MLVPDTWSCAVGNIVPIPTLLIKCESDPVCWIEPVIVKLEPLMWEFAISQLVDIEASEPSFKTNNSLVSFWKTNNPS